MTDQPTDLDQDKGKGSKFALVILYIIICFLPHVMLLSSPSETKIPASANGAEANMTDQRTNLLRVGAEDYGVARYVFAVFGILCTVFLPIALLALPECKNTNQPSADETEANMTDQPTDLDRDENANFGVCMYLILMAVIGNTNGPFVMWSLLPDMTEIPTSANGTEANMTDQPTNLDKDKVNFFTVALYFIIFGIQCFLNMPFLMYAVRPCTTKTPPSDKGTEAAPNQTYSDAPPSYEKVQSKRGLTVELEIPAGHLNEAMTDDDEPPPPKYYHVVKQKPPRRAFPYRQSVGSRIVTSQGLESLQIWRMHECGIETFSTTRTQREQ